MKIYVEPNANGTGSLTAPCSIDQALEKASIASIPQSSTLSIIIGGGHYDLDNTLIISPEHTKGANLRLINKEGETPVFSSGKPARNFTLHDQAKNIWVTDIDEPNPNFNFEHLWSAKGEMLERAWSGFNHKHLKKTKNGIKLSDAFGIKPKDFRNPKDLVMVGRHFWYYLPSYVSQLTEDSFIRDSDTQKAFKNPPLSKAVIGTTGYLFMNHLLQSSIVAIENAYEFLNKPGQWYFDRNLKKLYIIPEHDYIDDDFFVIYPRLNSFIKINGSLESPVKNVEIKGIHFRYNNGDKVNVTPAWPTEPTWQKAPPQKNALQINAGNNISISHCSFKSIGNEAIHFDLGGSNNSIENCAFENISGVAIAIAQSNLKFSQTSHFKSIHPDNKDKIFKRFLIKNNYLLKTATNNIRMGHAIAYSEFMQGLKVVHNEIDHTAGHAVRNGWRYGGYFGGHCGDIEYAWNKTSRVGMMGLSDYGSLYIACANSGDENKVHHNFVDGAGDPKQANIALYFDAHVSNGHFFNNVVSNLGKLNNQFGNYWVGFVASKGNSAYNNWVHGNKQAQDLNLPSPLGALEPPPFNLRKLFLGRRNKIVNNTFYDSLPKEFPTGAQQVIDKAGLEKGSLHIKDYLTISLEHHENINDLETSY